MRAWILSICGVVFLGVMIDVISPNGKMNTFIKSIFSLVFIFVLVTPIVRYINGKHDYQININLAQDDELINVITDQQIKLLEQSVVKVLIEISSICLLLRLIIYSWRNRIFTFLLKF